MKKILIWSVQHTGTFFASFLIASSVPPENQLHFGSLYQRHIDMGHKRYDKRSPFDFSDFAPVKNGITEEWYDKYITSLMSGPKPEQDKDLSQVDLDKVKILVAHDHHHKVGSQLIQAVREAKPEVPFIVPMRDPLLALHSKMWRETEIYENPDKDTKRLKRAERCVDLYNDLLTVPAGHLFYLPIDIDITKIKGGRIKLAKRAHDFAGIEFTKRAENFAERWRVKNSTKKLVKGNGKTPHPKWEMLKEQYLVGDLKLVRKEMAIELEYLRGQKKLKKRLRKIGYRELPWW